MKMVIVFDTDDRNGMINTIKIVDNLAYEYMGRGVQESHNRTFGKIEFIKMLRIFAQTVKAEVEAEDPERDGQGLRFAKAFYEKVWERKKHGGTYP